MVSLYNSKSFRCLGQQFSVDRGIFIVGVFTTSGGWEVDVRIE